MRVTIYIRVSTSNQVHDQTIDQQRNRLAAAVQQRGWTLHDAHIFRDDGWSGARFKRPGLIGCGMLCGPERLTAC